MQILGLLGSVWHEWSWQLADYPGTWYFYATSVLIYRINQGSIYHLGSVGELGQNPAGSGWNGVTVFAGAATRPDRR